MASEKVNFFEEHVEKLVLGVAGLFLIYAFFSWVVSSSRTVAVPDGSQVNPAQIDAAILKDAKRIKKKIDDIVPPAKPVPDFIDAIKAQQNKKIEDYPRIASTNMEIQSPLPTPTIMQMPGLADYKKIVAAVLNPGTPMACASYKVPRVEPPIELATCDIVLSYPIGRLKDAWARVFSASMMQNVPVIIYKVDAQVREVLDDGTALEPRPLGPILTTAPADWVASGIPEIEQWDGSVAKAESVRQSIKNWSEKWQGEMIQPGFWDVYVQEGGAKKWVSWKDYIKGKLLALPALPAGIKEVIDSGVMDSLEKQREAGTVLIWRHAQPLERLKKYSYQVRLTFLNPAYATNDVLTNQQDAQQLLITTDWSGWSEPVSVYKGATFKITGTNPVGDLVKVRVETECLGQTVTADMELAVGQTISRTIIRKDMINPVTNQAISEGVPVSFDTGAIIVKTERIKVPSKADLTSISGDAVEVLYLDEAGKLKSKIFRPR